MTLNELCKSEVEKWTDNFFRGLSFTDVTYRKKIEQLFKDKFSISYLSLIDSLIEREEGEKRGTKNYDNSYEAIMNGDKDYGFNSAKQETIDYLKGEREIIKNI